MERNVAGAARVGSIGFGACPQNCGTSFETGLRLPPLRLGDDALSCHTLAMSHPDSGPTNDIFEDIYEAMRQGDIAFLTFIAEVYPPFPFGQDEGYTRAWLTHAIHAGHYEAFDWILNQGVEVNFCDDEGYSRLKSLLEMERG